MSEKTEPEENKSDVDLIPLENIAIKSTKNSIFTLPLKRCFKICISEMKKSGLTQSEEVCIENCICKHLSILNVLSAKSAEFFDYMRKKDPKIRELFPKQEKEVLEAKKEKGPQKTL